MTGTLPCVDFLVGMSLSLLHEVGAWMCYISVYTALFTLKISSQVIFPTLPALALFWISHDRGPRRRIKRAASRQTSDVIYAYDVRLMVLTLYCLYAHLAFLFSNKQHWIKQWYKMINQLDATLEIPSQWILLHANLWPPDGTITATILFLFAIVSQVYVLWYCIKASVPVLLKDKAKLPRDLIAQWYKKLRRNCRQYAICLVHLSPKLHYALSTIYAFSSSEAKADDIVSWDINSTSVVVDNAANTHIWNNLEDFVVGSVRYFDDADEVGVLTIDKDSSRPLGVGTVIVKITEDNGDETEVELHHCLYFLASPVKIISVSSLASQYDDLEGTWIKSFWQHSVFHWDHDKHSVTFYRPTSKLPVLHLATGSSTLSSFALLFDKAGLNMNYSAMVMCQTCLPMDKKQDVCLTSEEVKELDDRNVKPQIDLSSLPQPGTKVKYFGEDGVEVVDLVDVSVDSATQVQYFTLLLRDGHTIKVTKEFIGSLQDQDLSYIPVTKDQVEKHLKYLDARSLEALLVPVESTPAIKEFMAWHVRTGHLPFHKMFKLCKEGYLPKRFLKLKKVNLTCPHCIVSKCRRRAWRSKGLHGSLRKSDEDQPGNKVSIDHLVSAQPGLVPRMDGRHTRERITGACVFIDNATRYSYTHLQTSLDGDQTVAAKNGFEYHSQTCGVNIDSYHADNGIFAEKKFRDQVAEDAQTISYCAVGAHHQNGIVERHIGLLTQGARTNLLYAQRRWPEAVGSLLWPFAWKDFETCYNNFYLDNDGLAPIHRFTKSKIRVDLRDFHPFGCPVFVLALPLQSGMSAIPKWDPRACVGIYLGHSPCHAGNVALVLNPKTLRVSPQFHVFFDDEFTTVLFMRDGQIPPNWSDLVKHSAELATSEHFDLATSWANNYIANNPVLVAEEDGNADEILLNGHKPIKEDKEASASKEIANDQDDSSISEEESNGSITKRVTWHENVVVDSPSKDKSKDSLLFPTMPDLNDLTLRRSTRKRKPRVLMSLFVACTSFIATSVGQIAMDVQHPHTLAQKAGLHAHKVNMHFDGTLNELSHTVLSTAAGDNDTYTLREMLKQDDKSDFILAMVKEVTDHESRNHWTIMPRSAIPKGTKTILAVWSFKRKRLPDGTILKHKARLCAHGGMQTWGVNYWETYAPVVNWLSVRMLMILSIIHDLETRSIDFVLAFPQAPLNVDIYMEPPYGFDRNGRKDFILKLNKNLYGLKDVGHKFWNLLRDGLRARGYDQQSETDPCVFIGKECVILTYVDDCIMIQRRGSSAADDLIASLKDGPEKFEFTDDGNLEKYLGVDVHWRKDGKIELTQPHLITRILEVLGMDPKTVNPRSTPAVKPVLSKDVQGKDRKTTWSYRQAVGMLNYLQGTTRPDISMAVHQVARFCIDPKLSHERAVQRIGKYLIETKEKGINFEPDPTRGVECFVDADFAGGWNQTDADDAGSVFSRTGYVIMYSGCPIAWKSKLQSEIALSTTEAEYIALSQALRDVIPLMQLLEELKKVFPLHNPTPKVHCKVWEDNNGALSLAQNQKFSPRTKHIAIKYHHFREHVAKGTISIHAIDTKEQTADIFTKPLDENLFKYLRSKLCGW